jgi:hypothetical protein
VIELDYGGAVYPALRLKLGAGLVVAEDANGLATLAAGNPLYLGGTAAVAEFTTPYHLLKGGTSTNPSRMYLGSSGDPAIYLDSTNGLYIRDLSSNVRYTFTVGSTPTLSLNGTQVLTVRKTGWSVPTGTLSRAAFDESTVTLAQLAQRVAALITDLRDHHGIIGA